MYLREALSMCQSFAASVLSSAAQGAAKKRCTEAGRAFSRCDDGALQQIGSPSSQLGETAFVFIRCDADALMELVPCAEEDSAAHMPSDPYAECPVCAAAGAAAAAAKVAAMRVVSHAA